jgi:predicted nucleic acid-binding protein
MVAAIRSNAGASQRIVRMALAKRCTLLVSVPLVIEYEAVMTRPEHLAAAGLSATDIGVLLDAVVAVAEPVRLAFLWRPQLGDPNDDMVLETAVNGRAKIVATFNRRDFGSQAMSFGIEVLAPGDALAAMEAGR